MKITKRDIKFFFLGVLSLFIIETFFGWNDVIKDMKRGFIDGYNEAKK
ncbi:hypothetical protein [Flavobacterium croceum]|mgnify:CR=1 FL=1|uniref:Uncharacterized protein n=1 Tax=Flavobacterium croceum DSM 17960 TaxID=1121886 RepID=A0A2S4N5L5_9FLAO|nr:hypothetical protein [Flavobacterium croceum]POS01005.1 hypothetical protein Q361_11511 [Flavobacterium croceum DSM 17960]